MTAVEKDVTVVEKLCGKGVTCRKKVWLLQRKV